MHDYISTEKSRRPVWVSPSGLPLYSAAFWRGLRSLLGALPAEDTPLIPRSLRRRSGLGSRSFLRRHLGLLGPLGLEDLRLGGGRCSRRDGRSLRNRHRSDACRLRPTDASTRPALALVALDLAAVDGQRDGVLGVATGHVHGVGHVDASDVGLRLLGGQLVQGIGDQLQELGRELLALSRPGSMRARRQDALLTHLADAAVGTTLDLVALHRARVDQSRDGPLVESGIHSQLLAGLLPRHGGAPDALGLQDPAQLAQEALVEDRVIRSVGCVVHGVLFSFLSSSGHPGDTETIRPALADGKRKGSNFKGPSL